MICGEIQNSVSFHDVSKVHGQSRHGERMMLVMHRNFLRNVRQLLLSFRLIGLDD
jgi:hypothetical protein